MSFSHWTRIISIMNYLYYEHKSSQVCTVKEDERLYHACLSTHNYLNEMCLMNGSSLKGRQEAFIFQMKTKKFIPIVVNISKHEVYFPNKSKKHMTAYGSIMPISMTSRTILPIVELLLKMVPS